MVFLADRAIPTWVGCKASTWKNSWQPRVATYTRTFQEVSEDGLLEMKESSKTTFWKVLVVFNRTPCIGGAYWSLTMARLGFFLLQMNERFRAVRIRGETKAVRVS